LRLEYFDVEGVVQAEIVAAVAAGSHVVEEVAETLTA